MRGLLAFAALAAVSACQPQAAPLTDAQKSAIADSARAVGQAIVAGFTKLDLAAAFKDYAADPDVRYMENGALYPSYDAFKKANEEFVGMLESVQTTIDAWDAIVLGTDAVVLTAPWHGTIKAKGRPAYVATGVWSGVVQRRGGRWQVVHTHESIVNADQMMAALMPPAPRSGARGR
ncbi:MAG: nuclear transport factor 2 family protein [Gemmatimonadetes bacterium]|nr:nuclear transport factor 2 family protein [Gemmatimonadota bacterium]